MVLLIISLGLAVEPIQTRVSSSRTFRITNRRFISHLAHEKRGGEHFVTILTTHGPGYHAFHADNHPLRYPCQTPENCLTVMKKLNKHLMTGRNLGLKLKGSQITKLLYYK